MTTTTKLRTSVILTSNLNLQRQLEKHKNLIASLRQRSNPGFPGRKPTLNQGFTASSMRADVFPWLMVRAVRCRGPSGSDAATRERAAAASRWNRDVHFRSACGGQKLRKIMMDSNIELYGPYKTPETAEYSLEI
ncbi:Photosynthetic NDH subunit of subcomplex B 3 [Vigna angularis]|uniref:Photosynthetic NDH subunit of subcomplex B 3 n=1 Tax=Phaseolus angularis TaxID=3914 RepID=A0A8T0KR11_PHAAN|nr:Photosynthetic NDH subunit of subcomplex B 3 [Vigna angularis]